MASNPTASLLVMADHLDRYHEEVGAILPHYYADENAEVVSALVELERALRSAARLSRRAAKLASRNH